MLKTDLAGEGNEGEAGVGRPAYHEGDHRLAGRLGQRQLAHPEGVLVAEGDAAARAHLAGRLVHQPHHRRVARDDYRQWHCATDRKEAGQGSELLGC